MSCTIASNNVSSPQLREDVSKAVRDGIGDRPEEWSAVIYQAPDYSGLAIRITGPQGKRWNWTFYGDEQSPEFIQRRVANGIVNPKPAARPATVSETGLTSTVSFVRRPLSANNRWLGGCVADTRS